MSNILYEAVDNISFQLDLSPDEYARYLEVCDIRKMDCSTEELVTKRRQQSKRKRKLNIIPDGIKND